MPIDWKPAKRRQKDMDARWTKKHGKSYFGDTASAWAFRSSRSRNSRAAKKALRM